jgi:hypothetical protein
MSTVVRLDDYRRRKKQLIILAQIKKAKHYAFEKGSMTAVAFLDVAMAHAMIGDTAALRSNVKKAQTCLINGI